MLSCLILCGVFNNVVCASDVCLLGPAKVKSETFPVNHARWHENFKNCLLSSKPQTNVVTYSSFDLSRFRMALLMK